MVLFGRVNAIWVTDFHNICKLRLLGFLRSYSLQNGENTGVWERLVSRAVIDTEGLLRAAKATWSVM